MSEEPTEVQIDVDVARRERDDEFFLEAKQQKKTARKKILKSLFIGIFCTALLTFIGVIATQASMRRIHREQWVVIYVTSFCVSGTIVTGTMIWRYSRRR